MAFKNLLTLRDANFQARASFPGHLLKCHRENVLIDLPIVVFDGEGNLVDMIIQNVNIGHYEERDEFLESIRMLEVQCFFSEKGALGHVYRAIEKLSHLLTLVSTLVVRIIGTHPSILVFNIPPVPFKEKMKMFKTVFSFQHVRELEGRALNFQTDVPTNEGDLMPTLSELVIKIGFIEYFEMRMWYLQCSHLVTVYAHVSPNISSFEIGDASKQDFEDFCKSISTIQCCDLVEVFSVVSSQFVKNLSWEILDWSKDVNVDSIHELGFQNLVTLTILFPKEDYTEFLNILRVDYLANLKQLELHNAPSSVYVSTYEIGTIVQKPELQLLDYFCIVNFRGEIAGFISAKHVVVRHSDLTVCDLSLLKHCSVLELSTSEVINLCKWKEKLANVVTLKIEGTVQTDFNSRGKILARFELPNLRNLEIKGIPDPANDRCFLEFHKQEFRLNAKMVPNLEFLRIVAHRVSFDGNFPLVLFWSLEHCELETPNTSNCFALIPLSAPNLRILNLVSVKGLEKLRINERSAPSLKSLVIRQASNYYYELSPQADWTYRLPIFSQPFEELNSCFCCSSGVNFSPIFPQLRKLVLRCSDLSNETPWDPVIAFSLPMLEEVNISKPLSIPNFYDIQFPNCTRMILGPDYDQNSTPPSDEQIAKIRSCNKQSFMEIVVLSGDERNGQIENRGRFDEYKE